MMLSKRAFVRVSLGLSVSAVGLAVMFFGCRGDYTAFVTGGDFLASGRTASFFTAIQVDPRSEDSAGPQLVVAEDLNGDGLIDLVSAWNQSQPVQIHLQRRSPAGRISFETVTLAGNIPVVRVAGLAVADFDGDDRPDIAVLIKESGLPLDLGGCLGSETPAGGGYVGVIILYLAPAPEDVTHSLAWVEVGIGASLLYGRATGLGFPPEEEGFTAMTVGDMDLDGDADIVVAWDSPGACNDGPEVLLFTNLGGANVQDGTWNVVKIPDAFEKGPRLFDEPGIGSPPPRVKDVALGDIDHDGDLDIVATFPDAASLNVRWYRNPCEDIRDAVHISEDDLDCANTRRQWQTGTVGQIAPKSGSTDLGGADALSVADIDRDGILDVVVRSTGGRIVQWLKGPDAPTSLTVPIIGPTEGPEIRHLPWQVYTIAEFNEREPDAIALGDLNGDGQLELIASAEGALVWFSGSAAPSLFDQWIERLIIDDNPSAGTNSPPTTDPNVTPSEVAGGTFINAILVVDLDDDGRNDLVATLDRSGKSGLSNDVLVWFRNTQ